MPFLRNFFKLPLVAVLGGSMALSAVPQEPAQAPALKKSVNLVNLFATVRDKSKRIVGDLKQDDFKVYEDNQEQKLAFFSKEVTMPITLGLLIDTSGASLNSSKTGPNSGRSRRPWSVVTTGELHARAAGRP